MDLKLGLIAIQNALLALTWTGGAKVFAATCVSVGTDDSPREDVERYPNAKVILISGTPHGNDGDYISFYNIDVEVQVESRVGRHGEGAIVGGHGKYGLAEITNKIQQEMNLIKSAATGSIDDSYVYIENVGGFSYNGTIGSVRISFLALLSTGKTT